MFKSIYKTAIDQLKAIGPDIRLIILHPNYTQQHRILTALLTENTFYVRFEGQELTRESLHEQLRVALKTQTNRDALKTGDVIVLDECDRANSAELDIFLPEVVSSVGSGRVFVLTRVCPRCVLDDATLRGQTCFLPVDEKLMFWDYAQRNESEKPFLLEVRALGTGRVLLNGKLVNTWDGVLPRSLFFYLVDKGMTTRNDIFETFWPNLSIREATNVFHVTKRKISEVLGTDLTSYWSGFYHIAQGIELSYDVVLFAEMVRDSQVADAKEAAELLRLAIWLYRDEFLTLTANADWVTRQRLELRGTYCDALIALAKIVEKQGEKAEALGLYLRASATNPQREDIARSAMMLYREMDMPQDALDVYQRLADELRTSLNVAPAKKLQELAEEIRRMDGGVK